MRFEEYRFEDLPNIMAENNRLLSEVKELITKVLTPTKEPSDLMSIQEVSELLNLSIATLYTKVSKRELPYSKRGKKLYFSRTELLEFVKAGRKLTTEEIGEMAVSKAAKAMKGGA
jgi:excisionase family DNA binding protein